MTESLGTRLRQQRERQQIDLGTIAKQTKIKLSLLEELERDDASHWPTGIFRRAFIRTYAHAIGLDQEVVVREFMELHPDPIEIVEPVSALSAKMEAQAASLAPPTRFRYLVDSVIDRLRGNPVEQAGPREVAPATTETRPAEPRGPDLTALAHVCSELSRVNGHTGAAPLVREIAKVLDAVGVVVWAWDTETTELKPTLADGYSDSVLAHLPRVGRDADNATAAAFRSVQTCVVRSTDQVSGALAVPLVTPAGCVGVLAIELKRGSEQLPAVRAAATIVAAQLARLVEARPADTADRHLA